MPNFGSKNEVIIDTLRLGVQETLAQYPMLVRNMTLDTHLLHMMDGIVFTFTSMIANVHKQDKSKVELYKYPATVWEFFKEKYAPEWVKMRWPVRYTSQEVVTWTKKNFMCPHIDFPNDGHYHHVMWMASGGTHQCDCELCHRQKEYDLFKVWSAKMNHSGQYPK